MYKAILGQGCFISFAKEGKTMIYNYYPGCTLSTKAKQPSVALGQNANEGCFFALVKLALKYKKVR